MKIIADTNLIVRVLTRDDPAQFEIAAQILDDAEAIVVPIVTLCETVWVLTSRGRWSTRAVAHALRTLLDDPRVVTDRALVDHGLALLDTGGDFADGVIAADGKRLADAIFTTFDREAAQLLSVQEVAVTLLG